MKSRFQYPLIFLMFFLLVVIQTSFLAYFSVLAPINVVFIVFFIITFFRDISDKYEKELIIPFAAGLFLDAFYMPYFGFSIMMMTFIYFSVRALKILILDIEGGNPFIYFVPLFFSAHVFYQIGRGFFSGFSAGFTGDVFLAAVYNSTAALVGFSIYKIYKFVGETRKKNKQMSLKI